MSSAFQRASWAIAITAVFCAGCTGRPDRAEPAAPGAQARVAETPGAKEIPGAPVPAPPVETVELTPERAPARAIEIPAPPGGAGREEPRRRPPTAPPGVAATALDLTPPEAPSNVVAKASTDHVVEVSWAAPPDAVGVTGWEVMRGGDVVAVTEKTAGEERGLSPAREYCYTVRALDAAGNRSEPGGPACATTPDLQPPSPPPLAEAVATGEARIALRWKAATDDVGVVRYEVERASKQVASVPGLEAAEAGLEPWTEYCYVVRAVDAAGNRSAPAGPLCARTMDTTPPTTPANLVAAASAEDRVDLSWQASKDDSPGGVVDYEVRRGAKVVANTTQREARETGLRAFTEHCYTVVAVDGAGNRSAAAGPACARTPDVTPPTVPGDLVLYPAADSRLEARWRPSTDNHGVAGYELVRGERVVASPAGTSAVESKLAPATEYCYRVRAYDAAGNRSRETGPVCTATLAVNQPPPPRNVAIQRTPSAVLRWDVFPSPGLVYRVYEDGRRVGATRFPSYAVLGRIDKRRCYAVSVLDGAGRESPRSEQACLAPAQGETASR